MRSALDMTVEEPKSRPFDPPFLRTLEERIAVLFPFLRPYMPALSRLARFLCVGVVGLAVDAGIFAVLFGHGAGAPAARAASLFVATFVTWLLNRLLTFGASGHAPLIELARYAGVAVVAQGFNYAVFLALHYATGEAHPFACLFAAAVLTTVFSFTGQSAFAFARPHPSRMNP